MLSHFSNKFPTHQKGVKPLTKNAKKAWHMCLATLLLLCGGSVILLSFYQQKGSKNGTPCEQADFFLSLLFLGLFFVLPTCCHCISAFAWVFVTPSTIGIPRDSIFREPWFCQRVLGCPVSSLTEWQIHVPELSKFRLQYCSYLLVYCDVSGILRSLVTYIWKSGDLWLSALLMYNFVHTIYQLHCVATEFSFRSVWVVEMEAPDQNIMQLV